MPDLQRAYATLTIKAVDEDTRLIEGIASTPETDRMGDVLEPEGALFALPMPLLWQHRSDQPIGHVTHASITKDGIKIRATIAKGLLPRIDEAWALIKSGLVRGLSVGFRPIESARIDGTFGLRFLKWDWMELSAVTIPANADATILTIKSLDAPFLAASGLGRGAITQGTPGGTGSVRLATKGAIPTMKTYTEQIQDLEHKRAANVARLGDV
jgi:HK97 family phage prohead protease